MRGLRRIASQISVLSDGSSGEDPSLTDGESDLEDGVEVAARGTGLHGQGPAAVPRPPAPPRFADVGEYDLELLAPLPPARLDHAVAQARRLTAGVSQAAMGAWPGHCRWFGADMLRALAEVPLARGEATLDLAERLDAARRLCGERERHDPGPPNCWRRAMAEALLGMPFEGRAAAAHALARTMAPWDLGPGGAGSGSILALARELAGLPAARLRAVCAWLDRVRHQRHPTGHDYRFIGDMAVHSARTWPALAGQLARLWPAAGPTPTPAQLSDSLQALIAVTPGEREALVAMGQPLLAVGASRALVTVAARPAGERQARRDLLLVQARYAVQRDPAPSQAGLARLFADVAAADAHLESIKGYIASLRGRRPRELSAPLTARRAGGTGIDHAARTLAGRHRAGDADARLDHDPALVRALSHAWHAVAVLTGPPHRAAPSHDAMHQELAVALAACIDDAGHRRLSALALDPRLPAILGPHWRVAPPAPRPPRRAVARARAHLERLEAAGAAAHADDLPAAATLATAALAQDALRRTSAAMQGDDAGFAAFVDLLCARLDDPPRRLA